MIRGLAPIRCAERGCPHLGLWQLCNDRCPSHRRDYVDSINDETSLADLFDECEQVADFTAPDIQQLTAAIQARLTKKEGPVRE